MQNNSTKLIILSLNASFPACYEEIVRVPSDITEQEIADLVRKRWGDIGGDEFTIDHSGFAEDANCVRDCEQGLVPELVVSREGGGVLSVAEVSVGKGASLEEPEPQPAGVYVHFDEDRHAIIAALRFWQRSGMCEPFNRDDDMQELCTNGGEETSLSDEDIDDLIESLNMGKEPDAFIADLKRLTKQ